MKAIRLSSFILMLMFTLLEARRNFINKQPHYQGIFQAKVTPQNEINNEAKGNHLTIVAKGIKSSAVLVQEEDSIMRRNGRKLASKGGLMKAKELAKMSTNDKSSSKISGATPSSWNCNHKGKKRRKMDVSCNQSARTIPKKAKFPDGFVALSADYHFPKSHPPRHN